MNNHTEFILDSTKKICKHPKTQEKRTAKAQKAYYCNLAQMAQGEIHRTKAVKFAKNNKLNAPIVRLLDHTLFSRYAT